MDGKLLRFWRNAKIGAAKIVKYLATAGTIGQQRGAPPKCYEENLQPDRPGAQLDVIGRQQLADEVDKLLDHERLGDKA